FTETPIVERAVDRIVATTKRSESEARSALAANNPQARFIKPEEVAAAVVGLCAGDSAAITGQAISISGCETWLCRERAPRRRTGTMGQRSGETRGCGCHSRCCRRR